MAPQLSAGLAALIAKAYQGGAETSLAELAVLLNIHDEGVLQATETITVHLGQLGLGVKPDIEQGEFDTPRVLRPWAATEDDAALILDLLALGEGPKLEFKSSLICSMHHWVESGSLKELAALPGEALKTICAFLNSDGGDLLIGIDNSGTPCGGIERDLDVKGWDLDKWQLHLYSLINGRFHQGELVSPFLTFRIIEVETHPIAHVAVLPRAQRSFVRREKSGPFEFFVRNGSRTDSLDLPAFAAHMVARGATA